MWQTIISKAKNQEDLNGEEMMWFAKFWLTLATEFFAAELPTAKNPVKLQTNLADGSTQHMSFKEAARYFLYELENEKLIDAQTSVRENIQHVIKFMRAWHPAFDINAFAEKQTLSFSEVERAITIDMQLNIESVELELIASMNQTRFDRMMYAKRNHLETWQLAI